MHLDFRRPDPSAHRPLPKVAINARRRQTAVAEIPIAPDAPSRTPPAVSSLGRFRTPAPVCAAPPLWGPASENLVWGHRCQETRHEVALGMAGSFARLRHFYQAQEIRAARRTRGA